MQHRRTRPISELEQMGFQVAFERRMFSHSRMLAGREFQVDGAATEKARRASSLCVRETMQL